MRLKILNYTVLALIISSCHLSIDFDKENQHEQVTIHSSSEQGYQNEILDFTSTLKNFWYKTFSDLKENNRKLSQLLFTSNLYPDNVMIGVEISVDLWHQKLYQIQINKGKLESLSQEFKLDRNRLKIYVEFLNQIHIEYLIDESANTSFNTIEELQSFVQYYYLHKLAMLCHFIYNSDGLTSKHSPKLKSYYSKIIYEKINDLVEENDFIKIDKKLIANILEFCYEYNQQKKTDTKGFLSAVKSYINTHLDLFHFTELMNKEDFLKFQSLVGCIREGTSSILLKFKDFVVCLHKGEKYYSLLENRISQSKTLKRKNSSLLHKLKTDEKYLREHLKMEDYDAVVTPEENFYSFFNKDFNKKGNQRPDRITLSSCLDGGYFDNAFVLKNNEFRCESNGFNSRRPVGMSSIIWHQFSKGLKEIKNPESYKIETIRRVGIINSQSLNVIWTVLEKRHLERKTIQANSTEGKAILGTPNGKSALWLAHDRLEEMEYRIPSTIEVYPSELVIHFEKRR